MKNYGFDPAEVSLQNQRRDGVLDVPFPRKVIYVLFLCSGQLSTAELVLDSPVLAQIAQFTISIRDDL